MKLDYDIISSLAFGCEYTEFADGNVIFSRFSKVT